MKRITFTAAASTILALLLWGGFGTLVWELGNARVRLATREAENVVRDDRDRSSGQLQTLMRDTREEREALDGLIRTDALAAAATLEAAGKSAGVTVSINGAVSGELEGTQSDDVRAVTLVANAEGEFSSLMKVAALFETLPFPSRVEAYEFGALPPVKGTKDPWRMTARIRVLIPSEKNQ